MKKKLLSVLVLCLTVGMLTGCGKNGNAALKDMDMEKYVTLGKYNGIEVSVAAPSVDDTQLEELMLSVYQSNITQEYGVKDRAVAVGDTVNIDFVGKRDGVAFDGGTSSGYDLVIGSGSFIDGFEDGLVGVMPGETVDLNLTFPTEYKNNPDLAGQPVVFTVTVNYILPVQYEDKAIAAMGIDGVTNEAEYRQYVYDYLYDSAQQDYTAAIQNAVVEKFMAGNVISEVPEYLLEKYKTVSRQNIEQTAAMYGTDADTFVTYYYNMGLEEFLEEYCLEAVRQDMAFQAVANKENLNITDEELDEKLLGYANDAGFDTIEEYIGETSKEDYREYFLYDKILNYLTENAVVTE